MDHLIPEPTASCRIATCWYLWAPWLQPSPLGKLLPCPSPLRRPPEHIPGVPLLAHNFPVSPQHPPREVQRPGPALPICLSLLSSLNPELQMGAHREGPDSGEARGARGMQPARGHTLGPAQRSEGRPASRALGVPLASSWPRRVVCCYRWDVCAPPTFVC